MDGGLRSLFRKNLLAVDWLSVETAATEGGVPDSNGCLGGAEFWVEHKSTDGWTPAVCPAQVGWALRRARHGGRVFFAVRRVHPGGRHRGPAVDELWLVAGAAARELKSRGLRGLPRGAVLGHWHDGPSRWDWGAILRVLVGG